MGLKYGLSPIWPSAEVGRCYEEAEAPLRSSIMVEIKSMTWAVYQDETTDGDTCWVCQDLDLEGCIGQGLSPEEATADWVGAREEYLLDYPFGGHLIGG